MLAGPLLDGLCLRCLAATVFPRGAGARRIADYELLGELGRGGMGVVYLARQVSLDRLVALKVLVGAAHASPEARARFQREAREAARLSHPHIVTIHEVGEHEGTCFYSMDLIGGDDLEARCATRAMSPRDAATLVLRAARAVQHAHEAGVLHRDIKPGNILIDEAGEPHLTDFGLALAVDGGGRLTQTGELLGSPAYIAPEQLRGAASVACDVYALGAVLYFVLTHRPPFVAAQLPALLAAVERGDPVPPRRLDPSLPRDLETIALRALAREPTQRYASAGALADDLARWLDGRPIHARPVSLPERAWRWSRRNRALAAVAALLAITVFAGAVAITWQWRRAEHAAALTAAHLYASELKLASDAILAGDLGAARRALERCAPERRDVVWGLLWPQAAGDAEHLADGPAWTVTDLAVSTPAGLIAAAAQDDLVRIWHLDTHRELHALPGTIGSWSVAFDPDGQHLFTAGDTVRRWRLADGSVVGDFPGHTCVLSPDGAIVYTCTGSPFVFSGEPGVVAAWRVADGAQLFELPAPARVIALSRDGSRLATSDAATTIALVDARDGRPVSAPWPARDRVWALAFSPDDRQLAASGWSRVVRIWDLADTSREPHLLEHPLNTWQAEYSPDGSQLAVASSDQAVHLWDTATWTKSRVRRGHENEVWSIAWQPDGRLIAAGRDPRILRWSPTSRASEPALRHDEDTANIVWLPNGQLATVRTGPDGRDATIITDLNTGAETMRLPNESPLAYDPATRRLWSWAWTNPGELRARGIDADDDPVSMPWVPEPGGDVGILENPRVNIAGALAWAATSDGALEIRHLADGRLARRVDGVFSASGPIVAALSPDGRTFVWTREARQLHVLDLPSDTRTRLEGHHYDVPAVVFAPDGRSFVTGGHDGLIFEWTSEPPHRRRELHRLRTSVGQLGFSHDERIFVAHEPNVGVRFWDRPSGREVAILPEPDTGASQWGDFSLEGGWFALRRADGIIRAWRIAPGTPEAAR